MKWQTKAFVLRRLSSVYGGKRLYLALQGLVGTTRIKPRLGLSQTTELIKLVEDAGESLVDRVCVDVGTGWYAFAPLALYLAGAKKIITVDINPWLSFGRVKKTVLHAEPLLSWFAEAVGIPERIVRERYAAIDTACTTKRDLLAQFNTTYWYPADARCLALDDESIDVVMSSNVLEHIPYDVLEQISNEAYRILKSSGIFVHRFGPGDHFVSVDPSITSANFLQFTSEQWRRYNEGLAFHNRLRCSQYKRLFAKCGFELVAERISVDEKAVQAIQRRELLVSEEFSDLDVRDLAANYMRYLGRKTAIIGA